MGVACQIASSSCNLVPRFARLSRSVGKGGTGRSRSPSGENPENEVASSCSEYSLQELCLLSIPVDSYRLLSILLIDNSR